MSPGYDHVVLDGPGVKSDQLRGTRNRYRLSSFQCVVLVNISSNKPVRINKYLSYSSSEVEISEVVYVYGNSSLNIIVPGGKCKMNPCWGTRWYTTESEYCIS